MSALRDRLVQAERELDMRASTAPRKFAERLRGNAEGIHIAIYLLDDQEATEQIDRLEATEHGRPLFKEATT